jgi:hypothetical protein
MKGKDAINIQKNETLKYEKISEMFNILRKKLKISSLQYASNLTLFQIESCCDKILHYSKHLECLTGMDICISDGFTKRKNGVIEIAWDFKIA